MHEIGTIRRARPGTVYVFWVLQVAKTHDWYASQPA
jgi:hypothetical protein